VAAEHGAIEAIEAAYGGAPELGHEARERGLWLDGQVVALPLERARLARALPPEDAARLIGHQARILARRLARRIVGGGSEERSYRDWVVQRFGEPAYELLHSPYARRRWGDPERLSASVARLHHGEDRTARRVALGTAPAAGWRTLVRRAGRREGGQTVEALEIAGGRVQAVRTDQGRQEVSGRVFWAGALPHLGTLLGDALDDGTRWDLARLGCRHRVQVACEVGEAAASLPAELHIVRGEAPFFRLTRPGLLPGAGELSGVVVAHLCRAPGDGLWEQSDAELGETVSGALAQLGLPSGVEARVQRLTDYDPCWVGPWHPVLVRAAEALSPLGIHLAGRSAAYEWVDAGRELLHVAALAAGDAVPARELARTLLDPPVVGSGQRPSMARFVTA